jgi:hypothetical protein
LTKRQISWNPGARGSHSHVRSLNVAVAHASSFRVQITGSVTSLRKIGCIAFF